MTWRNVAFVLAAICLIQVWRNCTRSPAPGAARTEERASSSPSPASFSRTRSSWDESQPDRAGVAASTDDGAESASAGPSINGFKLPAWTLWFAPQPGENMLDYRDRMMPMAQAAIAPHRARVARGRDEFARLVNLDSQQRAQLDASVEEAATQIQDKLLGSFLSGDLSPATFKPMTGVSLARDVLDAVDQANRRFLATLREDQRAKLAQHPFDFADYLVFSARWEDALGVTQ